MTINTTTTQQMLDMQTAADTIKKGIISTDKSVYWDRQVKYNRSEIINDPTTMMDRKQATQWVRALDRYTLRLLDYSDRNQNGLTAIQSESDLRQAIMDEWDKLITSRLHNEQLDQRYDVNFLFAYLKYAYQHVQRALRAEIRQAHQDLSALGLNQDYAAADNQLEWQAQSTAAVIGQLRATQKGRQAKTIDDVARMLNNEPTERLKATPKTIERQRDNTVTNIINGKYKRIEPVLINQQIVSNKVSGLVEHYSALGMTDGLTALMVSTDIKNVINYALSVQTTNVVDAIITGGKSFALDSLFDTLTEIADAINKHTQIGDMYVLPTPTLAA